MADAKFNLIEWLKGLLNKEESKPSQSFSSDNNATIQELKKELSETQTLIQQKDEQIAELKTLAKSNLTPVDNFCMKNKFKIVKKVYKDKIIINNVMMPCDLREIFTPNSYVVRKISKETQSSDNDNIWYSRVMKKVNSIVTWTTDGRYDNYFYPNYTLTTGKGDCDDFSFAQMSIEPRLGVAFGYYTDAEGKKIGHAFAVGIVNDKLVIYDGTSNNVQQYNPEKIGDYYIHYIITKNEIYVVDGSVDFGDILWE